MHGQGDRRLAWREIDVMLLALATVVGVASWVGATVGVGYARTASAELAWANLGVVGLIISGCANALWLLRGRRAVGARRVSLLRLEPADGAWGRLALAGRPASSAPDGPGLVRIVGSRLVHRATCPLVAGKQLEPGDGALATGGATCRVCSP